MSSFLNPHFLFRYLYPAPPRHPSLTLHYPLHIHQPCLVSSLPTLVLSLSSICIRNRIWGTMLSYHGSESERENEWGGKMEEKYVVEAKSARNWRKVSEDGDSFHFVFIHLLFPVRDDWSSMGPNWTNDWVQIRRLALMNKLMKWVHAHWSRQHEHSEMKSEGLQTQS